MVKVLICDDDTNITKQLYKLLSSIQHRYNIKFDIEIKNNGDSILSKDSIYDIAILDIEMPGVSGLKISKTLKCINPDIIILILTSFSNYLDSSMDIGVFRYLSKPIDIDRFNRSFFESLKRYKQISKKIILDCYDEVYTIKTKDILYIENLKHGSLIVTKYDKYKTNKKPQEWYDQINQPNCFVYSHKSFIVNLQNVINFNKSTIWFSSINETIEIPSCISQRKYSDLKKAFFNFAGGLK
jgi:two-component system LytT family response regulator